MRIYLPMLYLHPIYHAAVLQTYVPVSRQTISSLPQKRTSINWPPSPTSSYRATQARVRLGPTQPYCLPHTKTYCDTNKPSTTLPLYSLVILTFSQSGPGRSRPNFPTAGGGKGWRGDRKHYKGEQASEGQEPGSLAAGFQTVGERQGQGAEWMQACTGREGRRRGRGKRSGTGCKWQQQGWKEWERSCVVAVENYKTIYIIMLTVKR